MIARALEAEHLVEPGVVGDHPPRLLDRLARDTRDEAVGAAVNVVDPGQQLAQGHDLGGPPSVAMPGPLKGNADVERQDPLHELHQQPDHVPALRTLHRQGGTAARLAS
eukprot:9886885-Lingulodinium_polyedra.AAC.1